MTYNRHDSSSFKRYCHTMFRNFIGVVCVMSIMQFTISPVYADIVNVKGKITFLRAHDVGSGWGPPSDFLDAEVIIRLSGQDGKAFGFQLRNDNNQAVRQGMLDLLRDAYVNNLAVSIDIDRKPGKNNNRLFRVMLTQ